MRGARGDWLMILQILGIIPADAGSTIPMRQQLLGSRDHPRGCGEHFRCFVSSLFGPGSSPRMRGAPVRPDTHVRYRRIIPADAGSTFRRQRPIAVVKDHPRGCGEHLAAGFNWHLTTGSSPRMRGARDRV